MIDWMQKHRKWLVITIWISTISFIAAGMVGWGSYSFSLNADRVARVGNIDITRAQFDRKYQEIFDLYNNQGTLDAQKAKDLGLDTLALDSLIQQSLLQNLALDLGIRVTKEEIIEEISKMDYFKQGDNFSPQLYKQVLKQSNIKPINFEKDVQDDILIQKILKILPFNQTTQLERDTFSFALKLKDRLKIQTIDLASIKINPSDKEVKEFWESTKQNYKTLTKYKIQYVLSPFQTPTQEQIKAHYEETKYRYTDENSQIKKLDEVKKEVQSDLEDIDSENKSLREYVELKKNSDYGKSMEIDEGDLRFTKEAIESIKNLKQGQTLKPIRTNDGYITIKLISKTIPQTKTFDEAKNEVKKDFISSKAKKELEQSAKKMLKDGFKGKDIGFVSMGMSIDGMSLEDSRRLIDNVFSKQDKNGYVMFEHKAIVYEILEQKLLGSDVIEEQSKDLLQMYKTNLVSKVLMDYLQKRYKVTKINFRR